MSLNGLIKAIQDIMRKDAGVDGDAQRLSQLVWMLFLKIFDDKEKIIELTDDNYQSPIPEELRWRNWAADSEGVTGDHLLDFVNEKLFKQLKNLEADAKTNPREFVVQNVFEDSYNYMKSGTLIRQVINKLNELDFSRLKDQHAFGDIYERLLASLQSAGNAGEFYTPRALTQFVVEMVDPQLGEKVLDPACGTGGFLTCAIEHMRKQVNNQDEEAFLEDSIYGVELKQLPHLLTTTNLLIHGVDAPTNIRHDDALSRPLKDYSDKDRVDCIVANPPFGGVVSDGIESNFPTGLRTRETADLFLLLFVHLLKPGGRAGIVLPDGSLFGEGGTKERIKERLLTECNLHTIVRLPNGVFSPYTSIKSNLLFFTKGEPTKEVWYYDLPLPEGIKNYSKSKPLKLNEFAPIRKWWGNREENEFAWKVSIDEIKERNYNLDFKNPSIEDEAEDLDTNEIITKLEGSLNKTQALLSAIKKQFS